jgi:hypothetical protein
VGLALGAWLAAREPWVVAVTGPVTSGPGALPPSLARAAGLSPWAIVAGGLAMLVLALAWKPTAPSAPGLWPSAATGLALGGLGAAAWLAGAPAGWPWGLSITGPSRGLLDALLLARPGALDWGTVMLLGVPAGAWLAAWSHGGARVRVPPMGELARRLAGGLLMGVGGTLAAGCNIGNALTGVAILAVNSLIATPAIVLGAAAALGVARLGKGIGRGIEDGGARFRGL